jgi:nucleotide-binding universal stress UspA family protein
MTGSARTPILNLEVSKMNGEIRILIGTDGSSGSRAAIEEGLELAQSLGAVVTFVAVRPQPSPVLGEPYYQRALTKELGRARAALAEAGSLAKERDIPCDTVALEGNAADEIVRLARERDADIIVVGTRGLGPFKSVLMGSVSTAVAQHADRPVLVARNGADALKRSAA